MSADDVTERAARVIFNAMVSEVALDPHDEWSPQDSSRYYAQALDAAGLLVNPEHDAAVAAEWADHFEVCQGAVGPEPLTVESMIAALRGPRPFGRMTGESDADA